MTIMTLREFLILFKLTERNVTITMTVLSHLSSDMSIQRKTQTWSQETGGRASQASGQACETPGVALCCIMYRVSPNKCNQAFFGGHPVWSVGVSKHRG